MRIDPTLIKESTKELKELLKTQKHSRLALRIQMLILLKEMPDPTFGRLTEIIPVGYSTLKEWWRKYKKGGLEELLNWKVTGYRGKMNEEQLKEFIERLDTEGFGSQKEMIEWIYRKFEIKYSPQGISTLLKRIGAKKKVGRPVNIKKDEEKEKEFKEKEFKKIVEENPDRTIFF